MREYANAVRVRHGVAFGVRIGLNSGDVVIGKIGDDLRMVLVCDVLGVSALTTDLVD